MEELTTIGLVVSAVVGITTGLIALIKFSTTKFFDYLNRNADKGKTDNNQEVEIALLRQKQKMLESNHLIHQKAIEVQLVENTKEHTKISVVLAKICQKLGIE